MNTKNTLLVCCLFSFAYLIISSCSDTQTNDSSGSLEIQEGDSEQCKASKTVNKNLLSLIQEIESMQDKVHEKNDIKGAHEECKTVQKKYTDESVGESERRSNGVYNIIVKLCKDLDDINSSSSSDDTKIKQAKTALQQAHKKPHDRLPGAEIYVQDSCSGGLL